MAPRDDTQTLVDELILDYLLYTGISALFAEFDARNATPTHSTANHTGLSEKVDRTVLLVNSILQIYQTLHPAGTQTLHRDVRFRLIVCRFLCLFLRRIDVASSFARLPQTTVLRFRAERKERLEKYLRLRSMGHVFPNDATLMDFIESSRMAEGKEDTALPAEKVVNYALQRFGSMNHDDSGSDVVQVKKEEEDDYIMNWQTSVKDPPQGHIGRASTGTLGTISGTALLSDSLPLFFLLTTWTSILVSGTPVVLRWMEVAVSFMKHAFMEDYLCHGVPAVQAICENFCWGVVPITDNDCNEENMEEVVINEMFAANGGLVSKEWEEVKAAAIRSLVPRTEDGWKEGELEMFLVEKLSAEGQETLQTFENEVVGVIKAIVKCVSKPVLWQLEEEKLEGVKDEQVKELLRRAGAWAWNV